MAGDFNKPATSDTYAAFASSVRDLAADIAKGLDPAVVSTTNIPTNTIRWTSASNKWQKWNGSAWADLSSLYAINISGNAATATNATNASAVPWSGVSSKPTTIAGFGITDLVASILSSFRKDNWLTNGVVAKVSGLMAWKNYGNNHVIFDASAGTAPDGSAVNNTTAATVWSATLPTLMGWNGSTTYGVRVDAARAADTAAACTGNAATATLATKGSTLSSGGSNGTAMTFTWSGTGGSPAWVWGGSDGVNMTVFQPSNMSVGYAASAGTAGSATTATVAANALGQGQTWQNVTASRAGGTTYTNSTGKMIVVMVRAGNASNTAKGSASITVSGIVLSFAHVSAEENGVWGSVENTQTTLVPDGATYVVTLTNATIVAWNELR